MLNKEFKRKDVERMRNLIKGKSGESAETQVGYTSKKVSYKEGDIWEENGKKWIIKDGIKQTYTKLDKVKKEAILPLFCPCCGTLMKKHLDTKVYPAYQKCFDCVVDYEAQLQKEGKSEEYFTGLRNDHVQSAINEFTSFMEARMKESNNNFVTEAGDVESWKGGISKEQIAKELKEGIEFLEELKIK